jgi:hypothetical protein
MFHTVQKKIIVLLIFVVHSQHGMLTLAKSMSGALMKSQTVHASPMYIPRSKFLIPTQQLQSSYNSHQQIPLVSRYKNSTKNYCTGSDNKKSPQLALQNLFKRSIARHAMIALNAGISAFFMYKAGHCLVIEGDWFSFMTKIGVGAFHGINAHRLIREKRIFAEQAGEVNLICALALTALFGSSALIDCCDTLICAQTGWEPFLSAESKDLVYRGLLTF